MTAMKRSVKPLTWVLTWLLIAAFLLAVILAAGCRCAEPDAKSPSPRLASEKLGETLLAAFRDRDYAAFDAAAPESCRERVSKREFDASTEKLSKEFGDITGWRLLGEAETPGFRQLLWLVAFERPARGKAAGSGTVRRELLFRLLTGETGDGVKIAGFGFL